MASTRRGYREPNPRSVLQSPHDDDRTRHYHHHPLLRPRRLYRTAAHIDVIERNLREKVIGPDFRYPMRDGRTALARLCALQGRYDEASYWFADARKVLEEDGARPQRAIVDYDEALMYVRRNAEGDRDRALPLLDLAMRQFSEIGMTGWERLGEELRVSLTPT